MGWIRLQDEAWDVTMHRMKDRVEDALLRHPVMLWKERIAKYLWKFIVRVKKAPCDQWISLSSKWVPNECEDESNEFYAYRVRGRPYLKWDDVVSRFCQIRFNQSWQNIPFDVFCTSANDFISCFCKSWCRISF